jgi:ADP-ribose pyrophosphatase
VKRRTLHDGPVGSFGLEEAQLPSGKRVTLEILRHPGAAAVVPFMDDERILLLHQYRHAPGGTIWEVPAGKLDPGEDPEACAARELEEETGYRAGRIERTGVILTSPGFTDERIHLFCAYDLQPGTLQHEHAEHIEIHEVRFSEALDMIERGEIIDAKSIVALYHVVRRRDSSR